MAELSESLNAFSLKLFNKLSSEKNENFFISPFSISTALSMCYAGAKTETAEQLKQLLNLDVFENDDKLFESVRSYLHHLNTEINKDVSLNAANKIFPKAEYQLADSFLSTIKNSFHSEVQSLNFDKAEESAKTINDWVSEKTKNKINNLIPANALNSLTKLVLVNAIYFKGNWASQFKKEQTTKEDFHLADGTTVKVDQMKLFGKRFGMQHGPFGLQAETVELPYVGNNVSMTIILPNQGVSLSDVERGLSFARIHNILDHLLKSGEVHNERVNVYLPKFKLEYGAELAQHLSELGAPHAFDQNKADFGGINAAKNGLHISKVIHKAFVDVNEEGTEAAAATGVVMMTRCAMIEEPLQFVVDRPFLFLIHEKVHNTVLFFGKVVNPLA